MKRPLTTSKSYQHVSPQKVSWRRRSIKVILVIAVLVLLYPLLPWLYYQFVHPTLDGNPYQAAAQHGGNPDSKPGNRIVIPQIGVNAQIFDSPTLKVLDTHDGVWHDRAETNPTIPGNTVIAGHRFRYLHHISNHFYNLPKIHAGAKLYVVWDNKVYEYNVVKTATVTPSHTEIRLDDPKIPYKLTLYTCTLFNSNLDRFVVFAEQVKHPG
jgi:LPXTG-site transpeptidase (sortase) family protein